MDFRKIKNILLIFSLMPILGSCIHEYPHAVGGKNPSGGSDPEKFTSYIEVAFGLTWQSISQTVDFSTVTRARTQKPHRFIIEVSKDAELELREEVNISEDEFANGVLYHRIGKPLTKDIYQITVWYDCQDDDGEYKFDADTLSKVTQLYFPTIKVEDLQCAYATEVIDLTELENTEETYTTHLEMSHPGARIEIIATDINQFIANQRESLLQGDSYTVEVNVVSGGSKYFNAYMGRSATEGETLKYTGPLYLPFDEYEELSVAEVFYFCESAGQIAVNLNVLNSSLVSVAQTPTFIVPARRGYITKVSGDFLTQTIDGLFNIDTVWEGEMIIDL